MADIQDDQPTVATVLARRVAHYRARALPTAAELDERTAAQRSRPGITQRELSARMSALGFEMSREAIANVESGGRPDSKNTNKTRAEAVTVTELLGLALALNVPPVLLIAPLGDTEDVRVGTLACHPHELVEWLCGDHDLSASLDYNGLPLGGGREEWNDNSEPLREFRYLAHLIAEAHVAEGHLEETTDSARQVVEGPWKSEMVELAEESFDYYLLRLDDATRRLARARVSTPEIPDRWADRITMLRNRESERKWRR